MRLLCMLATLMLPLAACEEARLPVSAGIGPDPVLPPPTDTLIPTINIAPAEGWPAGVTPTAPPGFDVTAFATGLDHPRWLYVLPNGDVLVAETNAPPRPKEGGGLQGLIMSVAMRIAGAATESADRITLLRDADGDGVAEGRFAFLENLNSPFGMALVGDTLYVANTDGVVGFPYSQGTTRVDAPGRPIAPLPAGPRNHHWTKGLTASPDGAKLYAAVGSNSNIAEYGLDEEEGRAAIWEIDPGTGAARIFASGLRNPVGLAFAPDTGVLWTAVNERDKLGSDLVPDYLTSVREGGFYGWPWSYFGSHVDTRVTPRRPEMVEKAIVPDYALGPHTASLGLAFATGDVARRWGEGAFIGQHGSWNRDPPSGYKVIFVPFSGGRPSGDPIDVLTGFLDAEGNAHGRPVGVEVDGRGGILVADDVGNAVWRISPAAAD